MAVHTFDVAVTDVAALIGHLAAISATSSPSSTDVTAWITETASTVCAQLRAVGYTPSAIVSTTTGATLELYHQCRSMISRYVAAKWHVANRLGDTSMATSYRIQFDNWLSSLRQDVHGTTGTAAVSWSSPMNSSNARDSRWNRTRSYR